MVVVVYRVGNLTRVCSSAISPVFPYCLVEIKCIPPSKIPSQRRNEPQSGLITKETEPLSPEDRFVCSERQLQRLCTWLFHSPLLTLSAARSANIREAAQDPRLQAVIEDLLNDPNPLHRIKEVLKSNPDFLQFADQCLQCVGVRDDEGNCLL